ncbi:hypothetical protein DPMN_187181 [Dreissena polymorpha]|uniref:Uncharacterized protein n=1 Tax=Dreissena polymorpha TaxID=45954 RepID=A0A9D4I8T9_DREPO|nr:hypothetical protein DPMN_187181 [Dreissena polymorpha]
MFLVIGHLALKQGGRLCFITQTSAPPGPLNAHLLLLHRMLKYILADRVYHLGHGLTQASKKFETSSVPMRVLIIDMYNFY